MKCDNCANEKPVIYVGYGIALCNECILCTPDGQFESEKEAILCEFARAIIRRARRRVAREKTTRRSKRYRTDNN